MGEHQGEFGFYRVVFTALAEADDPEICAALVRMYRGFHQMIARQIAPAGGSSPRVETEDVAWALIGLPDPRKLELALDQGCTVVACHCGTGRKGDKPDMVPAFLAMLRKHKNLWGDTSILGAPQHATDCLRVLADPAVEGRLVHGSDFPFESAPTAFGKKVGWGEAARLTMMGNVLARDFALKEALGVGRPEAERAWRMVRSTA